MAPTLASAAAHLRGADDRDHRLRRAAAGAAAVHRGAGHRPLRARRHRRGLGRGQAHLRADLRLVGRSARSRKPQMVGGLLVLSVVSVLPAFFTAFAAFVVLRFLAGLAAAAYDPAARGMVVDATEPDERGEAFGFYGAFQIAGFVVGPAIGGIGSTIMGGYTFPFFFTGVLSLVGVVVLMRYLDPEAHAVEVARVRARSRGQADPRRRPLQRLPDAGRPDREARPCGPGADPCGLQSDGHRRARAGLRPAPHLRHLRGGVVDLPHRAGGLGGLGQPDLRHLRHPRDDPGAHRRARGRSARAGGGGHQSAAW